MLLKAGNECDRLIGGARPVRGNDLDQRPINIFAHADGAADVDVCAIGDPDQAIYGFRGADVGFFLRFREDYPQAKVLQILWVCGRLPAAWRSILGTLERWGEEKGCTEVETGGCFGWERQLREEGYAAVPWITLRKEL